MGINKKNLKRTREHIAEVNGSMLNMEYYRYDALVNRNPECNSIGCIIGHATTLDAKNVTDNFTNKYGIRFESWSRKFFGTGKDLYLWTYLFGNQHPNIKDYHLYRMDYILAGNKVTDIKICYSYVNDYYDYYDDGYFIPKGMEL